MVGNNIQNRTLSMIVFMTTKYWSGTFTCVAYDDNHENKIASKNGNMIVFKPPEFLHIRKVKF